MVKLPDINIRTEIQPGDLGMVIHLHGSLYSKEYGFGIGFETYVAEGLVGFYRNYNPAKDRAWICEHEGQVIGSIFLVDRCDSAQLRYFIIRPKYRSIGLGKKLMNEYLGYLRIGGYKSSYLWTTSELLAAAALYKRYGFVLSKEKESSLFGKNVIEQKYVLRNVHPADIQ